jgi:predicted negative regulator of RcsB-dependent stress response
MATHLDLEEQEQLDDIKHFWKQYGNAMTWLIIAVLGFYAAWNAYQYWQRQQSIKASALFEEVERAVVSADTAKIERAFNDMKDRFPSTHYAAQSALLAGQVLQNAEKWDAAGIPLKWASDNASDAASAQLARLRLANLQIQQKAFDAAIQTLSKPFTSAFAGLAADIQGDAYLAQNKTSEAVKAYTDAYAKLDASNDYRRLVLAKLNVLGVDPSIMKDATK